MPEPGAYQRAGRGDRRRLPRGGRRAGDRLGRCPTALIADGHEDARDIYVRYLDRFNFQVETAGAARDVFAVLRRTRPAVILLEARLPDLPPPQLAVWLATDRQLPRIPIIVLTGAGGENLDPDLAFEPAAILRKPFRLTLMIEAVRAALRSTPLP